MRYHDIALKSSVLHDKEKREQVKHARNNLIDVDTDVSEEAIQYIDMAGPSGHQDTKPSNDYDSFVGNNLNKQILFNKPYNAIQPARPVKEASQEQPVPTEPDRY